MSMHLVMTLETELATALNELIDARFELRQEFEVWRTVGSECTLAEWSARDGQALARRAEVASLNHKVANLKYIKAVVAHTTNTLVEP